MNEPIEPVLDLPLLRKAVDWVEAEARKPALEREWDQGAYRCPAESRSGWFNIDCATSYCVAGYVCQVSGREWFGESWVRLSDGRFADEIAAELLGITNETADRLFKGHNSAADIRRIAERIAEQAGEKL